MELRLYITGDTLFHDRLKQIPLRYPDIDIYTPVVDEGLNAHKFIVPGLGDFGDRLYGTL